MKNDNGYGSLLADSRFEAFLWTQFLGAFNDNVYKIIVSIMAVRIAGESGASGRYLAIAGGGIRSAISSIRRIRRATRRSLLKNPRTTDHEIR